VRHLPFQSDHHFLRQINPVFVICSDSGESVKLRLPDSPNYR
jgi:hypothetical protein